MLKLQLSRGYEKMCPIYFGVKSKRVGAANILFPKQSSAEGFEAESSLKKKERKKEREMSPDCLPFVKTREDADAVIAFVATLSSIFHKNRQFKSR